MKIEDCIGSPFKDYFRNLVRGLNVEVFVKAFAINTQNQEGEISKNTFCVDEEPYKSKVIKFLSENNDIFIKNLIMNNSFTDELNFSNLIKFDFIITEKDHFDPAGETRLMLIYPKKSKSLFQVIQNPNYEIEKKIKVLYDVSKAIVFLHQRSSVHRNINPFSIFIQENAEPQLPQGYLFLPTFFKTILKLSTHSCGAGYILYRAPEMIPDNIDNISYGLSVDIWAFGIILYEILFGVKPKILIAFNTHISKNMIKFANDLDMLISFLVNRIRNNQICESEIKCNSCDNYTIDKQEVDAFIRNTKNLSSEHKIVILKILQGCIQEASSKRFTAENLNHRLFEFIKDLFPDLEESQNWDVKKDGVEFLDICQNDDEILIDIFG